MLPGKKITPADMITMLRRRAWLIVIPPFVTLFVALLYSSTVENLYQSDMLIAIDPQRVPEAFVRTTVTVDTDRRLDALQVQVLSRTALQRMIEEFDLYPAERKVEPIEDVVLLMRNSVQIQLETPRPRWGLPPNPTAFHIRYTHPDPQVATTVTQRIGMMFVEQNISARGQQAGATNRFLEGQLAESRGQLEAQEQLLEDFRQRHGQELPTQSQSNMQSLQSAQMRAQSLVESTARDRDRKLMLERLYREAANDALQTSSATQGTATQSNQPAGAQQQLIAARADLSTLELKYKVDHPDIARARRQVAELEARVAEEGRRAAANPPSDGALHLPTVGADADPTRRESLRQMRAEIESLDRQIGFKEAEELRARDEVALYQRRLEAVPGLESEWIRLTRDYDTLQGSYRELLSKSTAAQVAVNLEEQDIGERFRIVDPAAVPVRPVESLRVRYNAGGLGIGLFFGLGLALLLELRDTTFRSDTDVLEVLGLPVLAVIPLVWSEVDKQRKRRRRLAFSAMVATGLMVTGYVTWALKLWKSLV